MEVLLVNFIMVIILAAGSILTLMGLPGNFLLLLAAVIYGWQEGFSHLTYAYLFILAGMWLGGELAEFFAGARGARKKRASWWGTIAAIGGSIAGGVVGTSIFPIIGTIAGAVIGAFAASYFVEYSYTKDRMKAQQVAKGVVKGQLLGMVIKFVVAIGMSVIIAYRIWF